MFRAVRSAIQVGAVRLPIMYNRDLGEYRVSWISNGRYVEGPSYYTDSLDDAIQTRADMARRESVRSGLPVVSVD